MLILILAGALTFNMAQADREIAKPKATGRTLFSPFVKKNYSEPVDEPAYCKMESPKGGMCQVPQTKLFSGNQAGDFVSQCPQGCAGPEVISREQWGAQPTIPTCTSQSQISMFQRVDQAKLDRGKAECTKNKAAHQEANRNIRHMSEPRCIPPVSNPKSIVVHHTTDGGFGTTKNVTPQSIQRSHMNDRGWSDIGYHFLIGMDAQGNWQVYEGRKKLDGACTFNQGAHSGPGLNTDSLGIAIAGNYEPESRPSFMGPGGTPAMPAGAVQKLTQLIARLKKECPSIEKVSGHGEHQELGYGCVKTQCPGSSCQHMLTSLQEIVK